MSGPLARLARWLPMAGWLLLVWLLLWGRLTAATLLSGLAVALGALWAARLPGAPVTIRPRPLAVLAALANAARDLAASSLSVAREVLSDPRGTRAGVVAVRVRCESDAVLALVANSVSFFPGSLTVALDRPRSVLYVHGLPVRDQGEAEALRRRAAAIEARVTRAAGLQRDRRAPGRGPGGHPGSGKGRGRG